MESFEAKLFLLGGQCEDIGGHCVPFDHLAVECSRSRHLDIFVLDYVPDCRHFHASELRSGERQVEDSGGFGAVEENQNVSAVAELASPNLFKAYLMNFPLESVDLPAKGILVDVDQLLVGQNLKCGVGHVLEGAANDERGLEGSPECKMTLILLVVHAPITHFKHIGVIPSPRTSVLRQSNLPLQIMQEGLKDILDIERGPPGVGHTLGPQIRLLPAPLAHREVYRSARLVESIPHEWEPIFRRETLVVAVVVFKIVDSIY
jgi:hypothetical protein